MRGGIGRPRCLRCARCRSSKIDMICTSRDRIVPAMVRGLPKTGPPPRYRVAALFRGP
jgi:hypothetical protein